MPKRSRPPPASTSGARPEHQAPAESFYSASEAAQYDANPRMAATQRHLADRALQLLALPAGAPALLLDVGCGTGYSGGPLERAGHAWVGVDLSELMLRAARARGRRVHDVLCADMGDGLCFRKHSFDGAISVSAVQWLCFQTKPEHEPEKRLRKFFRGLHAVLAPNARAALQVYPEQPAHMEMMRRAALGAGFAGMVVVDYPVSERSKKLFLVLVAAPRPLAPRKALGRPARAADAAAAAARASDAAAAAARAAQRVADEAAAAARAADAEVAARAAAKAAAKAAARAAPSVRENNLGSMRMPPHSTSAIAASSTAGSRGVMPSVISDLKLPLKNLYFQSLWSMPDTCSMLPERDSVPSWIFRSSPA